MATRLEETLGERELRGYSSVQTRRKTSTVRAKRERVRESKFP